MAGLDPAICRGTSARWRHVSALNDGRVKPGMTKSEQSEPLTSRIVD